MTGGKFYLKLVIFTVQDNKLQFYLEDKNLPSSKLYESASLDNLAKKIFSKTLKFQPNDLYFEQLYTLKENNKETNLSIIYYVLFPSYITNEFDAFKWYGFNQIKNLTEAKIIRYAIQRLRWKVEYTNVVYSLLPPVFTLTQLQETYEAILARSLDKRNFRKKILTLKLLKSIGKKKKLGKARPAAMYKFKKRDLTYVKVL